MGLRLEWHNRTDQPIPIKEIQVKMYLRGRKKDPLRFYPLERFARVTSQRGLQKSPVRPFTLPSHAAYTEQIRFISQEILDLPAGNYDVVVQIKDTSDSSYSNGITLPVQGKIKYRRSEEWQETEN
jgi:hypothetical protein